MLPCESLGLFATADPLSIMVAICMVQCEALVQQARTPKASELSVCPYHTQAAIPQTLFHLGFMCSVMKPFLFFSPSVDNLLKPCS